MEMRIDAVAMLTDADANGTLYATKDTAPGTWAWGITTCTVDEEDRETYPSVARVTEPGQKHVHFLNFGRANGMDEDGQVSNFLSKFTIVVNCSEYHNFLEIAADAQAPYMELLLSAVLGDIELPPMFGQN